MVDTWGSFVKIEQISNLSDEYIGLLKLRMQIDSNSTQFELYISEAKSNALK